jgi:hypothetical protein
MAKKTTTEWIEEAKAVHGKKYNYNKVIYIGCKDKVIITCPKHGDFEQTPSGHLSGRGCSFCAGVMKITTNDFISKANKIHNNKYMYNNTVYTGSHDTVIITCCDHGEFKQKANNHLYGKGCPSCSGNRKIELKEFLTKVSKIHGNKYNYSKIKYTNTDSKVKIICPIHGEFEQMAKNHLEGKGCQSCAKTGFDSTKPAILYYLKITTEDNRTLYKIGITNRSVNERFGLKDLQKIEIVKQEEFELGKDAYELEQKLLKQYKKHKYTGKPVLDSGNTELFTEDVLALYNKDD